MLYKNLEMRLSNLQLDGYFWAQGGRRGHWDLKDNLSPSVANPIYEKEKIKELKLKIAELTSQGKGVEAAVVEGELKKVEVELSENSLQVTPTTQIDDLTDIIQLNREFVADHMEERIGAFLMQIVDCYDTDKHYTIGKTQDQTESTPSVDFPNIVMECAAAHHGTLPAIYAYPRAGWEAWKAQNDKKAPGKPQGIVYHKYSDTYFLNNACTGLAKVINEADIKLDGNPTEDHIEFGRRKAEAEKKLRHFSIELLNRAARKEINPIQGFALYMAKLQTLVHQLADDHSFTEDMKLIFQYWKEDLDELIEQHEGNYTEFTAKMFGIKIPRPDQDAIDVNHVVFPKHFKIIQKKNGYQSHLVAKIDELKKEILNLRPGTNTIEKAVKWALIREASQRDEKVRIIFQRFFNCNGQTLSNLERECFNFALTLVRSDLVQQKVKTLVRNFEKHILDLTIEQTVCSVQLLKQIRETKKISLRKFADAYNARYPNHRRFKCRSLNYGQLWRIENGCVQVDAKTMKQYAKVLGVHKSVLLPELI